MTETHSTTRVKEIVMTYQQFTRPTAGASMSHGALSSNPSHTIHRKPPANYSTMPRTPVSTSKSSTQYSLRTPSLSSSVTPAPSSPYAPGTPSSTLSRLVAERHTSTSHLDTGSLTGSEIDAAFQSCLSVLVDAITKHGKRPFSAILLGPDNRTIVLTHNSISHVQHAESELARLATIQYSTDYLSKCTLVSTWEPCAMCAGTIYWSGIGRVLYAASEAKLRDLTGSSNEENLTMDLPCRTVLNAGQRKIETIGPIDHWEEKVVENSKAWWNNHRNTSLPVDDTSAHLQNGGKPATGIVIIPEDSTLSHIGEDGEYQADLKVDWMF